MAADESGFQYFELPDNERDAYLEIQEGFLDSATYELLKPFYAQSLSVPAGDLRYLKVIFGNLPSSLPVEPDVLNQYEPWDRNHIDLFFKDYPYLQYYSPILSFETKKRLNSTHVAFHSRFFAIDEMVRQSLLFSIHPAKAFRAGGTIFFSDNYARWQRRHIVLRIPRLGTIQFGNLNFTINRGLFYGFFQRYTLTDETPVNNWLYGVSRVWNGVTSKTPIGKMISIQTLYHSRETESIGCLKINYTIPRKISGYLAVSGSKISVENLPGDTSISIHAGINGSVKLFSVKLASGLTLASPDRIPLYCTLLYGEKRYKQTLTFIRIPKNFIAPLSRVMHTYNTRLDLKDLANNAITEIDLSLICPLGDCSKQNLQVSYVTVNREADLKVSWHLSAMFPFQYDFHYSFRVNNYRDMITHRVKLKAGFATKSEKEFKPFFNYITDPFRYWRIKTGVETIINIYDAIELESHISYILNSNNQKDCTMGVTLVTRLFDKTYGEVNATIPLFSNFNRNVSFYAKIHFDF